MAEKKHHYRAIAKSDHLGVADLEDFIEEKRPLVFTISYVKQEFGITVAGKKGNFNVAYFAEKIKPLVLNSHNSKVMRLFCKGSPFVEDWVNVPVELYIDETVTMKGEITGGVRIKNIKPGLPHLTKESAKYQGAVDHVRKGNPLSDIEKYFIVSPDVKKQIESDANTQ